MTADRFKQIDEILDAVWDLPEAEQERFLSARTGHNEELRREVLSLLRANQDFDDFLDKSAIGVAAKNLADEHSGHFKTEFIGRVIGTYRIKRQIGAGGMGDVYLAEDQKLKREVALKILPPEYTSNDERVKRFEIEARAISALNHPNIVTIHDVGNADGINFITTEFVEGQTLRELIGKNLKLKEILAIILQVCDALDAAHRARIIHRDIKPENIMIRPDGYVKIFDFGLAKLTEIDLDTLRNLNATQKGIIIGTPAYMSPYQISDDNIDHRTDLWSVGVVLYELLTGLNPFKKENRQATFRAILTEVPPPASSLNSQISADLDQILIKALEKDTDLSYQTASDFRADLKRVKREIDSSPSWRLNGSPAGKRGFANRQQKVFYWAFSFLLLSVVAVWLLFFGSTNYQKPETDPPPDWSGAEATQLTTQSGAEYFPSLAPDGQSLVYAIRERGNWDIYRQQIDGKNIVNLTPDSEADDSQPAYSPDGQTIAFRSERVPRGIYLMDPNGQNLRHLSDTGFNPAWSPDGKELVVSSDRFSEPQTRSLNPSPLWIINVMTGTRRQLFAGDAVQPSWSPGGQRIAYWAVQGGSGRRDIWTITTNGVAPIQVTNDEALDWNPIWSPDGKFLYYASNRSGSMNFWRVPIDQTSGKLLGEPEPVTTPSSYSQHLSFSPSGKQMIYVQKTESVNLYHRNWEVTREKITGPEKAITQGARFITSPEISPDGEWFAYSSQGEKQEDLFLLSKDGTIRRQLTNDSFNERAPDWSPDGNQITFYSDRSGRFEVWLINKDGTGLKQLTYTSGPPVFYPLWSPDGNWILFKQRDQMPFIIEVNKNWHEQTPIQLPKMEKATATMNFWVSSWSPDGNRLLGTWTDRTNANRSITLYDFATQQYLELANSPEFRVTLGRMRFVNDRTLLFRQDDGFYLIDIETKKIKQILKSENNTLVSYTLSPDKTVLYYTIRKIEANIWLLTID